MPRPAKRRSISGLPCCGRFGPMSEERACAESTPVFLSLDEYEALRLIDLEGLNQEECAARMEVARTTVQAIYGRARTKVADFLVNARELRIEGGAYRLYGDCGLKDKERCGHCHRHRRMPSDSE